MQPLMSLKNSTLQEKLKAILGVRAEYFVQRHTGRDTEFANSGVNGKTSTMKRCWILLTFSLCSILYFR
jgi:hypothetical protein